MQGNRSKPDLMQPDMSSKTPAKKAAKQAQNSPQVRHKGAQQQIISGYEDPMQTLMKSKSAELEKSRQPNLIQRSVHQNSAKRDANQSPSTNKRCT
jgi:hypothetical protein